MQPRSLYPAELSFRIEEQIKIFPDKKKLKEFIITKPVEWEMFEGLYQEAVSYTHLTLPTTPYV